MVQHASGRGQALPDGLRTGIESLSGLDMSGVRVHYTSPLPARLNALAYAQGSDIHLARGQEKHLPHEAWHVVQQHMGRVRPTWSAQGVAINDDPALEREADAMGARAMQFKADDSAPRALGRGHQEGRVVQRYLIVNGTDFTDEVKTNGANIDVETAAVLGQMEAAVSPASFALGTLENTAYNFLVADTGGLVSRQVKKWIEDNQGEMGGASRNTVFGRKQQARAYTNYRDLAMAIYGWVSSKEGRREEKRLAHMTYASPIIEERLNSVLGRIVTWIGTQAASAGISAELNTVTPAGTRWADYANWFNHIRAADRRPIPPSFYPVLQNPGNYSMREKIATLHDVMRYFMAGTGTQGQGLLDESNAGGRADFTTFESTNIGGRAGYARPDSTIIHRDPLARELATGKFFRPANEEQHASYIYARTHQIPMWARHSYTAARMMRLAEQAGATVPEITAVAYSIMSFWRKDYDHRSLPYHTMHEIMDFLPHFGGAYNPLTRYADMRTAIDPLPRLMPRLTAVVNSANWNGRAKFNKGSKAPESIVAIRGFLGGALTDVDKLLQIKNEIRDKTGWSLLRSTKARDLYTILAKIPDNVNVYQQGGTSAYENSRIAIRLSGVLRELQAFNP
ncbi:hypothetical protein B1992_00045 [Pseudoxanthomonas broegbernensis]|uniref:eCIS core domain-containing protein n=2 Tax=Pseudoxanthomonas broegbernensis TaxID=83619 RepID=A0A7V8GPS4_9GAMM|nr:DUF4157 domain-containing protein [Pseudoxanthomonas broegbernensis]KAF1687883.1 hypothetical protein B1992_00045 [Pseudoxanthomonas broegbernensis]